MKHRKRLCFAASSGGHLEQLLMLKPLMKHYESIIVTEKTEYDLNVEGIRVYYMLQVNRRELLCFPKLIINSFKVLRLFFVEKPDVIICTGVLAMIPLCLICKILRKKLIYIESFAKVKTPSRTGRLLYKFADQFYVQWPAMKKSYPDAIFLGGIY